MYVCCGCVLSIQALFRQKTQPMSIMEITEVLLTQLLNNNLLDIDATEINPDNVPSMVKKDRKSIKKTMKKMTWKSIISSAKKVYSIT